MVTPEEDATIDTNSVSYSIRGRHYARMVSHFPHYATAGGRGEGWRDSVVTSPRAYLLYFHGGGFLFGHRDDLPLQTLDALRREGFSVLSFDYGLAPFTQIDTILDEVRESVRWFVHGMRSGLFPDAPYFLWGRSAGAYLCLMAGMADCAVPPAGILSYYG
ncbi:MAG: alpha/beta hydrolase [Clostridiales Family XIII bacterium]|jgi:acetyl esterase/lipase|nr:alpha/beta hydrolase [Clostridiales Family XIII bacterium]